jgi:hypothetical protein
MVRAAVAKSEVVKKEHQPAPLEPVFTKGTQDGYKFEKQRVEESRLVKGIFQDNEVKGGTVKFSFKKFKGDPIQTYAFTDGCEYEIPLAVVKHLNSGCFYMEDVFVNGLLSAEGTAMKNPNPKKKHRFTFKTAEYN